MCSDKMKKFLPTLALISLALLVGGSASALISTSPIEQPPEVDVFVTIARIGNLLFTFLIVVAAVMLVIAGVLFVTAAGSETQITRARNMLLYALLGIVLAVLARGLVTLLRTYLGGSSIF